MSNGWDLSADFVSVGSGLAATAGALAAADAGLDTLLVEKTPLLGGSTVYSFGILWVPNNHLMKRQGVPDSEEEAREYIAFLGAGRQSAEHVDAYLRYAPVALEYFQQLADVRFYMVQGLPDHYYPVAPGTLSFGRNIQVEPFPAASLGELQGKLRHSPNIERVTFEEIVRWGGPSNEKNWDHAVIARREAEDLRTYGAGLVGSFLRGAIDRGVRFLLDAPAERLLVEDGEVVGLEVGQGGGRVVAEGGGTRTVGAGHGSERLRIRARKGVLLATGAYGANPRLVGWLDEYPHHPTHRAAASTQGDGLMMAMEQGAAIFIQHGTLSVQLAYSVPGETLDGLPVGRGTNLRELAAPHSLLINGLGERFGDESFFEDLAIRLRDFDLWAHTYPNRTCFLVFDHDFWQAYGIRPVEPGGPVPDWIASGDTLAELAAGIGVDAERLQATVERFNGFAEAGRDLDFHRGEGVWSQQMTGDPSARKNPNLGPISRPPFHALRLHPSEARAAGLVTNTRGQVIHVRGHAIPGLYACGDVAAQTHAGVGYQAGFQLTGGMTFGYLAAQHARAER